MRSFTFRRVPSIGGGALLALALAAGCGRPVGRAAPDDFLLYVGTNVASEQENTIFTYRVAAATGAFSPVGAQWGGSKPTYLAMGATRNFLYAVSETATFRGAAGGGVSAFAIDQRTGALTLRSQQPSGGTYPCYLSLDRTGRAALVANYGSGTVSLLPVAANGQLGPPVSDQHTGRGPHPNQTAPHAHCFIPDPTNAYAFAVDLGTDRVYGYRLDAATGQLTRQPEPAFVARPGAGPHHLTFHPNGRQAYLINELNSTVTVLAYAAPTGQLRELQTVSTLPDGYAGPNSCADLHVAPNGLVLYASNRGHNSLAVFAIDSANGTLVPIQHVDTQGKTPRNFALDPTGRLLLVANQNSNSIVSFRVDPQSGLLAPTGQSAEVPTPMFLQIVEDFTR